MELIAREQRDDQPVACAYGCQIEPDKTVRAGLLFVRERTPGTPLTFEDPATRQAYRLHLPEAFVNLTEDGWDVNQTLRLTP